jgi:hypothetical protein
VAAGVQAAEQTAHTISGPRSGRVSATDAGTQNGEQPTKRGRRSSFEGFFDTIAVHQAGYPVVALMGSTLSRHQADLLERLFDQVLLMLDGDDAGRQGAATIAATLAARTHVSTIALEGGVQPDQLACDQIRRLIREAT